MTDPRTERYEDALRQVAALTVKARRSTNSMGVLPRGAGEELLCDLEHVLSSLIVLQAVPPPRSALPPPPPVIRP